MCVYKCRIRSSETRADFIAPPAPPPGRPAGPALGGVFRRVHRLNSLARRVAGVPSLFRCSSSDFPVQMFLPYNFFSRVFASPPKLIIPGGAPRNVAVTRGKQERCTHPRDSFLIVPTRHSCGPLSRRLASAPLRTSAAKCRAANGVSGPSAPPQPPCAPPSTRRRSRPSSPSLITGCAIASGDRCSAKNSSALRCPHTCPAAATPDGTRALPNRRR